MFQPGCLTFPQANRPPRASRNFTSIAAYRNGTVSVDSLPACSTPPVEPGYGL